MYFIEHLESVYSLHDAVVFIKQQSFSDGIRFIALCFVMMSAPVILLMSALHWFALSAPDTLKLWAVRLSLPALTVTALAVGLFNFNSLFGLTTAVGVIVSALIWLLQPAWFMDRLTGDLQRSRLRDKRRRQYGERY